MVAIVALVIVPLLVLCSPIATYRLGVAHGLRTGNMLSAESNETAKLSQDLAEQALDEANHWRRSATEASHTIQFLEARLASVETSVTP